jgi:hypothetical protein
MPCMTCSEIHTSFTRALACHRRVYPLQERRSERGCRVVAPLTQRPSSAPEISPTSSTVLRDGPVRVRAGRAGRPGRPRVDAVTQRRKSAERARAYRARQHAAQLAVANAALAELPAQ